MPFPTAMRRLGSLVLVAGLGLTLPVPSPAQEVLGLEPRWALVGQSILVGISPEGAVASGSHRFMHPPGRGPQRGSPPPPLRLGVSIPIPAGWEEREHIINELQPVVSFRGTRYPPSALQVKPLQDSPLPPHLRLVVFEFLLDRADLASPADISLQFHPPVVSLEGAQVIYLLPSFPGYAQWEEAMKLRKDSFRVTFEAVGEVALRLSRPVRTVLAQDPGQIVVRPEHEELIAIERRALPPP